MGFGMERHDGVQFGRRPKKCIKCKRTFYYDPDTTFRGERPRKCPDCANGG